MNEMGDFDTSELRWWRCVAINQKGEIQNFTISIDSEDIYKEFKKVRRNFSSRGLQFIEAKPMSVGEVQMLTRLSQFRMCRQERLGGLKGRHYLPIFQWLVVLFVGLLFLIILLLVYLH